MTVKQLELDFSSSPSRLNTKAVNWNSMVKNGFGKNKYIVFHSGIIREYWQANNRRHLELLLRIQMHLGYMLSIDSVKEL